MNKPKRENLLKNKKVFIAVLVIFGIIAMYEFATMRMGEIYENSKVTSSATK